MYNKNIFKNVRCDIYLVLGMVAVGATVLMATSEETSNRTQNNSIQYENQNICSHYNEMHNNEQNSECQIRKNITSCNINSKYFK